MGPGDGCSSEDFAADLGLVLGGSGDATGCSSGGPKMVFTGCCHAFLSCLLLRISYVFFPGISAINGILGQLIQYPA